MVKRVIAALSFLLLLFFLNLFMGSVTIPFEQVFRVLTGGSDLNSSVEYIVLHSRLPQAITALLAGAALATAGLLLQTLFANPLAGPSILGIDAGAGLGVALVMLLPSSLIGWAMGTIGQGILSLLGAFLGASLLLLVLLLFSIKIRHHLMLLIVGIMMGYLTSSSISLLNFFAPKEGVFAYTIWGMGSFSGVSTSSLPLFMGILLPALLYSIMLIKPLNSLLLGDRYASNLGISIHSIRHQLLFLTGVITAVVTAFCGPISFVGLSVPHLARLFLRSSNHQVLLPWTMLLGSILALLCNLISILPSDGTIIPLNAITPILGAPVIIYIIIHQKRIGYFH